MTCCAAQSNALLCNSSNAYCSALTLLLTFYTHIAQTALGEYLYDQLALVGGLTLYGPATTTGTGPKRTGLVAFNCDTVHATDLSFFLDQEGVAVRTGTSYFHRTLDLETCYIPFHT
jgi:selenocysteine lyase/cysteine desulfurase